MQLVVKLYFLTAAVVLLGAVCLYNAVSFSALSWSITVVIVTNLSWIHVIPALVLLAVSAILYGAHAKKPAENLGVLAAMGMYLSSLGISYAGRYYKWRLDVATKNLETMQGKILRRILKHLSHTAYYIEQQLDKVATKEDFRAFHPLTKYDHYRPWIERIIEGEENVLTADKVDFLGATSGTTSGASKLFPKSQKRVVWSFMRSMMPFYGPASKIPGAMNVKPRFTMGFKTKLRYTESGLKIGALTSIMKKVELLNVSPYAAREIPDFQTSLYVQLLFALKERELGMIIPGFASHAYALFKMAEEQWRDICADIRSGEISDRITATIPPYLLEQLRAQLIPDPQRADELEVEFKKGIKDFVPRVWPCCWCILSVFTGPFVIYKTMLQAKYVGGIRLVSYMHGSTECVYGINIWPEERDGEEFIMIPTEAFLECLEYDEDGGDDAKCVLPHEVEIGKKYEIVVTTYDGLYRYRTNDVIEVTRYHNEAPVYIFLQRADDNLSVFGEKTPISVITAAFDEVSREWGVIDFTATENIRVDNVTGRENNRMGYFVIMETSGYKPTLDEIAQLDIELRHRCEAYDIYREKGRIGPIEVLLTDSGAFQRLRDLMLGKNPYATLMQFKVPRLVREEERIRCLLGYESRQN